MILLARLADFISCVAFGKQAEFIEKYFRKGMRISYSGRIQTGSYTNREGQKVYTTNVVVEEAEFCESKQSQGETHKTETREENRSNDGFVNLPEGIDDELPFN
jgi:single-strand DNA-binding protein